jgi:hypothetical protein
VQAYRTVAHQLVAFLNAETVANPVYRAMALDVHDFNYESICLL